MNEIIAVVNNFSCLQTFMIIVSTNLIYLSQWDIYAIQHEIIWQQHNSTETTTSIYKFMFFLFKMAVAIAFLCENAVEAIQVENQWNREISFLVTTT